MENFEQEKILATVAIGQNQIQKAVEKAVADILKSEYSNPVRDAVASAIKDKTGLIKAAVDEIITAAVSNPDFKIKMADFVMAEMIRATMKK